METIVSSYLSKKLPLGSKKSLSDSLETASRVQGLLSDDIVFEKTGPQTDPWLKTMESLQTTDFSQDHIKNGSKEKNSLGFFGVQQKAQKRLSEHESDEPQVILRNSGSRAQVGLTNVGNTCYFNSMLQCLTNCKPFYNYIRSEAHDKNVCRRNDNCVLCLLKVFSVNHLPVNPTQKVINGTILRDLLVKMRTAVRRWKIHAQQSADEILSYVMDSMWEREMQYYSCKQNQTPMFNIFGTVIEQQYACSMCGKASIVKMVEPTIILGLINGDRRSVQDRLRVEYGLAETLSEPKDKCNGCGRTRTPRPTMKRVLKDLPMILVVMLKRFYVIDGISHKINQFVQFPETLDLRPCMDPLAKNQNSLYKLTGVVEHWGKSVTDGHYVAYCKNYCNLRKTEGWFYLNDTLVRPIDLKDVLQKHAYLLFYTSQNQTIRTVKLPPKISNPNSVSPAHATQAKIRKSAEGQSPVTVSPSTSKIQTNGIAKIVSKKFDLEPPRLEPTAMDEPGCSGYSNNIANNAKVKDELSNGKGTGVATSSKSPTSPAAVSKSNSTSAGNGSAVVSKTGSNDAEGQDASESHKDGTARSKSYTLLVDCNGNSHKKHRDKNVKKSIFTNLGSKLIMLKNLPPDQTEVPTRSSLVPYESSDEDDNEADDIVTNKIVPPQSAALNGSRFSSSLTWVIDKFNDAPSVASNSSQNSSVHGTSPGWKVSSTDTTRASSPHSSSSPSPAAVQPGNSRGTAKTQRSPKEKVSTVSYCPKMPAALLREDLRKKQESRSSGHGSSGPASATAAWSSRSFDARAHQKSNTSSSSKTPSSSEKTHSSRTSLSEPRSYVEEDAPAMKQRSYSADRSRGGEVSSNGEFISTEKSQNDVSQDAVNGFSYWGASIESSKSRSEREEYDEDLDRGRQRKMKHRHPWKGGERRAENPFQREQDMRYKAHGGGSILHKKSFKDSKHSSRSKHRFQKWSNGSMNGNHNGNHHPNGKPHWRFNSRGRYAKNQGYHR